MYGRSASSSYRSTCQHFLGVTMLRVAPLVVTMVCCVAILPNSQAKPRANRPAKTPANDLQAYRESRCSAGDARFLYNHVKAPAFDLGRLDRFKIEKDFDMDKPWHPQTTVSVMNAMLPLSVGAQSRGSLQVAWFNTWDRYNQKKEPELAVYNDAWYRAPLRIHAMDQKSGGRQGKGSVYIMNRAQDRDLTNWIDTVFSCKKVYLDYFLFMDAPCVMTPWGQRDYRVIIGTSQGDSYVAVVYSNRGIFGGKHFVSESYQGIKEWQDTSSSIHLMRITDGTNPGMMDYQSLKFSNRCHAIGAKPAPVHNRRTSSPSYTPPNRNNARSHNSPADDEAEEIGKLRRGEFTKMQNEMKMINARVQNLERKSGRK